MLGEHKNSIVEESESDCTSYLDAVLSLSPHSFVVAFSMMDPDNHFRGDMKKLIFDMLSEAFTCYKMERGNRKTCKDEREYGW